ncbi:uncharacterized protein LOC112608194 [Theropithecus gelada]|uniref:uncharacterized protein LOC112608194 n=1 Tax=Theropithecus gelada TaxID=9565 RepID=UPI000DC1A991|nr:uncharacterized protein LOC112608194 [Theropithecus gelada]
MGRGTLLGAYERRLCGDGGQRTCWEQYENPGIALEMTGPGKTMSERKMSRCGMWPESEKSPGARSGSRNDGDPSMFLGAVEEKKNGIHAVPILQMKTGGLFL